jgi:hypothetical protein
MRVYTASSDPCKATRCRSLSYSPWNVLVNSLSLSLTHVLKYKHWLLLDSLRLKFKGKARCASLTGCRSPSCRRRSTRTRRSVRGDRFASDSVLPDFSWCNIPNGHKIFQMSVKYTKWPYNIPNVRKIHHGHIIYQHLPLWDPPKSTQIRNFG